MRQKTPVLINVAYDTPRILRRSPLQKRGEGAHDELWLQTLVHNNATVLPLAEIEPASTSAVPVCTELRLSSGYLDNLLVTPLCDIIGLSASCGVMEKHVARWSRK
jgi:hypothetical protein